MADTHSLPFASDGPLSSIGLIRHARTEWNRQKRIQGQTDNPLCHEGVTEAQGWGESLVRNSTTTRWDRIVTSPLLRARQTAEALNASLQIPISTDERLREQHWGKWEGYTIKELRARTYGEVEKQEARGWEFTPTGGEPRSAVRDRMFAALTALVTTYSGEHLLLVTHLSCIKCVVHTLLEQQGIPVSPDPLKKHGLHRLQWENDTFTIQDINGVL